MIIDAHAHAVHGDYLESLYDSGGKWLKEKTAFLHRVKPQVFDIPLRLQWLERNGIDLQVVTPHHTFDSNLFPGDANDRLHLSKVINDNMSRIIEDSQGKMLPVASIPIADFEEFGRKEMDRAIDALGLLGVNLPSNLNGKPIDLPEFESFWAYAAKKNIPVFIHPHDPAGCSDRSYEAEYSLNISIGWPFEIMLALCRIVFSGLLDRYPELKIVTHMGGGLPFFWGRLNETYHPSQQARTIGRVLPKPLIEYFSKFYYDIAIGGNAAAIRCACDIFGSSSIIFATDAPWGPETGEFRLKAYQKAIESLQLTPDDERKIFCDNAKSLIDMD
jgi:aminocarboxymuconate-semialdehyde decarboxylase